MVTLISMILLRMWFVFWLTFLVGSTKCRGFLLSLSFMISLPPLVKGTDRGSLLCVFISFIDMCFDSHWPTTMIRSKLHLSPVLLSFHSGF